MLWRFVSLWLPGPVSFSSAEGSSEACVEDQMGVARNTGRSGLMRIGNECLVRGVFEQEAIVRRV